MADNVNLASPSGTARADEVGGFLYQTIKLAFGPDNTATDVTATDPFPIAQQASEVHLGEIGGKTIVFPITLSTDTSAYASNDLIADTQIMDGFFRKTDGTGVIQSLVVIDQDDQKAAIKVVFLDANVSLGTENAGPSISDANAVNILGIVNVITADYIDLGGVSVATIRGVSLPVKAVSGTDDLYVAVVSDASSPTYTASGLKLRFGALLD